MHLHSALLCHSMAPPLIVGLAIVRPPGISMPPAGLCFNDVTFLNVALLIRQQADRSQRVNTVDEKNYYGYKFDELWSSKP